MLYETHPCGGGVQELRVNRFDCRRLRRTVLDMAYSGSTSHLGPALSIIELLAVLYRSYLRYPDENPDAELRDYLVLSKGHGVMAQYACLRELGWISEDAIRDYCQDGTRLKGLSDSRIPGLEVTSGSLGHGFSVGVGLALAAKRKATDQKVYALCGDGEINEGPIWEGALFAAQHCLDNLVIIIDANGQQAMGRTREVLCLDDIGRKLEAFGFEAATVDGHDEAAIKASLDALLMGHKGKPKALVANTVKGKGVSFMEDNNMWHYLRLNSETYAQAVAEVEGQL